MKKHRDRRNNYFSKSVENRGFLQNSQGGRKRNFQKWPIFWANFGRLEKWEIQVI